MEGFNLNTYSFLTYEIIGGYDNAAQKQYGRRNPVVCPENHVVDHGLVYEVADFDKARYGRNHSENGHFDLFLKKKEIV